MAYFRNNAVNLLNLHFAVQSVALSGGGAFFCVYLRKAGLSMPQVLLAMAAILLGRFLVRPVIMPLAIRFGLRTVLIIGTVLASLQYLLLPEVRGVDGSLVALCLAASLGDTVYWPIYHAYFASIGDREHRGHQIGIREALTAVVGIVSPLVTVSLLALWGPRAAFYATACTAMLSTLPLFRAPQVKVAPQVRGAWKAAFPGVLLFLTDGWMTSGLYFLWQVTLFDTLNDRFESFGGALALAALAGAVGSMVLGRKIDGGHGGRAVWLVCGMLVSMVLVRAASPGHPTLAVVANAVSSISGCLYSPTLMTVVYNLAKHSPCPLRFQVAMEGAWDVGNASASLLAAALLWHGESVSTVLLLPLIGVVAIIFQLRGYYAEERSKDRAMPPSTLPVAE